MALTIIKGGREQSLANWGISLPVLTRRSFEKDEFEFTIRRQDCLSAADFAYDDQVELRQDGVTRFIGKIRGDRTKGEPTMESVAFTCANFFDDLECLVYQQNRKVVAGDFVSKTDVPTTQVTLFRNPLYNDITKSWAHWTTNEQIQALIDFARTAGVSCGRVVAGDAVQPPWSEARDITVAAALRRCQLWVPDSGSWVDYSAAPPALNVDRRAVMDTASIDLTGATQVLQFDCRPRNDLVPRGVVLIFQTAESNSADGSLYSRFTTSVAGATVGPRVLIQTLDLTALENEIGPYLSVPVGGTKYLAQDYFDSLQTVHFDGLLTLKHAECPGTWHPGQLVTFLNGRPEWEAGAVLQEVDENFTTGVTKLRFGAPSSMAAADFLTLLLTGKFARKDTPGGAGSIAANSTGLQPSNAGNSVRLDLCDGSTVTVLSPGVG
jgi:hypothetical protein